MCESPNSLPVKAGEPFTVSWLIENHGQASSAAEIRYYLSADSKISTADKLLKRQYVAIGGGGQNAVKEISATVTAPEEDGVYWIGSCGEKPGGFRCNFAGTIKVISSAPSLQLLPLLLDEKK